MLGMASNHSEFLMYTRVDGFRFRVKQFLKLIVVSSDLSYSSLTAE